MGVTRFSAGKVARQMGNPSGWVADICVCFSDDLHITADRVRVTRTGTDFHIFIQTDAGKNRHAVLIRVSKVFYKYILIFTVKIVVQTASRICIAGRFIGSRLADALPRKGTRKQNCRRQRYCRRSRSRFLALLYCLL